MPRQSMRLLIVDDSPADVELLRFEFEREGYNPVSCRVETESDLRDALHTAEWDMVIADDSMPRLNSMQALNAVKKSGRDIPFIIYSGTMNHRNASVAMREGVQDYVVKGDFARLIPSVERELKNAAVRKAMKRAESHVYRLAYYDQLTGLPNRNYFCERVGEQLNAQPDMKAAVVFVDIDNFMRLNNSFGYTIGDVLMRQVASRMEECTGGKALLARLRGDEFVMFVAGTSDRSDIEVLMAAITRSFSRPFAHDSLEFDLAVSMGICMYPEDGQDATTLIANAEGVMSEAKAETGTSYKYYDRKTVELASCRVALEGSLRRAVERNELFLQYQPIADVRTGAILATEALVRWRHPEFGFMSPDKFIPIADETGLIISIGEWVLREACRQTRAWHDLGFRGLGISVNVSAVQFAQTQLLTQIKNALNYSGLAPQFLEVEITESVLMRDAEATASTLKALKDMGVCIAMDDFGTGYSSLSYLKRFPIDTLKIDKSFTQDICGNHDGSSIVSAIAALGRSLDLNLVAEGVETSEQREFLETQQCDRMQGYLLSKPLQSDHVARFLTDMTLGREA
ncbi:MAG: GGDEF domain-containing response regulator [Betaproteobacteria bacterium]|nr:GGDEF domain-containing response regulator [Betaproteobacteria bacterium]